MIGILVTALTESCVRLALELEVAWKHHESPGRLASAVHGLCVAFMIARAEWEAAVLSTGIFFCIDTFFNLCFSKMPAPTLVHHLLGMFLCFGSHACGTLNGIGADLTKSLVMMEVTNPTLHLLVVNKREEWNMNSWLNRFLKLFLIVQWVLFRIWDLGVSVFLTITILHWHDNPADHTFMNYAFVAASSAMWVLQLYWFVILLASRNK